MELTKEINGNKIIFHVSGRLDLVASTEFNNEMNEALQVAREIHLDFTNLQYISSTGLRILLSADKKLQEKDGKLIITNCNEIVMTIFKIAGFLQILNIS